MNDAPSTVAAHMIVAQETNPIQTPTDQIQLHLEPVTPFQTPSRANINTQPHVEDRPAGQKDKFLK